MIMSNETTGNEEGFKKPNFASDQWTRDYIAATANGPLKASGKSLEEQGIEPEAVPRVTITADTSALDQALATAQAGGFVGIENADQAARVASEVGLFAPGNVGASPLGMEGYSEELLKQVLTPDQSAQQIGANMARAVRNISQIFANVGLGYDREIRGIDPADGDDYTYAPAEFDGLYLTDQEQTNYGMFRTICEAALTLFMHKNREYGNSIVRTGAIGSIVAMTGDIAKLRTLVLHNLDDLESVDADNVKDKLVDVLVQAVIGVMMIENGNWLGTE